MGYVDEVLADSPRHYWRLDESSGNFANLGSAGGSGTAGAGLTRSQTPARPVFNSAVYFNGTSAATVTQSQSATLWQSPYTLELWFKTTVVNRTVVWFKDSPYWYLSIDGFGRPYFVADDYQSGVVSMESPSAANNNQWHHAAVTINHGGVSRFYIDGVQVASKTFTPGSYSGTAPIEIGDSRSQFAYTGLIDEVAIYPTALSGARIAAHYNATESGPPLEVDSGYPNLLSLVGLNSTLVLEDAPEPPLELLAGFASVLDLRMLGSTLVLEEPPLELLSGFANVLDLVGLNSTLVLKEPPLEVNAGFASVLDLGLLNSTLVLEDAAQPGLELLSGMAFSMKFRSLNSTLSLTTPPAGGEQLLSGLAQRLTLRGLGVTLDTESSTSPAYGEWFLEVVMPNKRVRVENPTSSLKVRNARKRLRSELKTRVKY